MTTPDHEHRWARDNALTGQSCMDCQTSGWDWHVDEVRRLRAQVRAQDEVVEAVKAFHETFRGRGYLSDLLEPAYEPIRSALARLDTATAAEGVARE